MNEKFNKNAKVEKFTLLLGKAVRLIVIDPLQYLEKIIHIKSNNLTVCFLNCVKQLINKVEACQDMHRFIWHHSELISKSPYIIQQ